LRASNRGAGSAAHVLRDGGGVFDPRLRQHENNSSPRSADEVDPSVLSEDAGDIVQHGVTTSWPYVSLISLKWSRSMKAMSGPFVTSRPLDLSEELARRVGRLATG